MMTKVIDIRLEDNCCVCRSAYSRPSECFVEICSIDNFNRNETKRKKEFVERS